MIPKTMKLILTGTSGFIGSEVLSQALTHPSITSIVALSRKPIPNSDPKLKVVLIDDFEHYSPSILSELSDAEACIWTIGAKSTDSEVTRKVTLNYSQAAASAFSQLPHTSGKPFRFVFVSGILAVRDQKKTVLLYPTPRKIAGLAESKSIEFSEKTKGFESYVMRPASVLPKVSTGVKDALMGMALGSIRVDELVAVLIDTTVNGSKVQTMENRELVKRGRVLLSAGK